MTPHIPTYKRWLSYFAEQVLETASSDYNDYLHVSLVQGRLQLVAEDAIYSFGDYYLNFRKVFDQFKFAELPEDAEVLVLGLGLGSIPELLENHFDRRYNYVAVEIDPVIIELATVYSLPALTSNIEVIQADAATFALMDQRRYDLICVDVFQDATIPGALTTQGFLHTISESLKPNGALIYNRLADTSTHRDEAADYYEDIFKAVFPDCAVVDTGGNYMLVNHVKFVE